ncbi:MAG: MCE family protein [Bradymonadales bacterium]|nr:MCE family protein [Bradymonadales bacterium]
MNPKVRYTLVGLFVMVLGIVLAAGIVWLSTAKGKKGYIVYMAYVHESVSGLNPNASVTYSGVDVGRVTDIKLDREDPQRVKLMLEIEDWVPIKEDTVATLVTQGITGIAHVELRGGTRESPPLQVDPEEGYPVIETVPSLFTRLDLSITGLVDDLRSAITSLEGVADRITLILNEENQQEIATIMAHVADLTETLTRIALTVDSTMHEVETTTRNVSLASNALPNLVDRVTRTVRAYENTGEAITVTAGAVTLAVEDVVSIMRETQADLAPFSRGLPSQIVGLVGELQRLGASLSRLVQDLERDPSMLLFGRPVMAPGPGE